MILKDINVTTMNIDVLALAGIFYCVPYTSVRLYHGTERLVFVSVTAVLSKKFNLFNYFIILVYD